MGKNSNNAPPIIAIQTAIGAAVGTGAAAVTATAAVDPIAQLVGFISTSPCIAGSNQG
jgi:hypothetical protein